MRILGIDPGYERVGFGLIDVDESHQARALDWGVITTSKHDSEAKRLHSIYTLMTDLLKELKPNVASLEKIFFFRNTTTMVPVCQARGVLVLTLQEAGLDYAEYTPLQVKMNMTGYGKSSKREVQEMVQHHLKMDELPRPDDAADALGVALCYLFDHGAIQLAI